MAIIKGKAFHKMFLKESKEHPTLPKQTIKQIVKDHYAAYKLKRGR